MAVTVFLVEEYGYRTWIWRTGMTPTRLIAWWKALPTVSPFFFNPSKSGLPGDLMQAGETDHEPGWWSAHLHMDEDSWLRTPDDTMIHHEGYTGEGNETSPS